jgi:flagellar biosynthesis GTPase FlhF
VEAAVQRARVDLGPDALLVSSRPAPGGEAQYEVVFAEAETPAVGDAQAEIPARLIQLELASLSRRVQEVAASVQKTGQVHQMLFELNLEERDWFARLCQQEVSEGLAASVFQAARADRREGEGWKDALGRAMSARIRCQPTVGRSGAPQPVVALAGPCGAGKTTMAAQLAAYWGVARRRSVHFVNGDLERVGAAEMLRQLAGILGAGYSEAEGPDDLAAAFRAAQYRELVIMDLPGLCPDDPAAWEDWARALGPSGADVHLVLPASVRAADLHRHAEAAAPMAPTKLIATHLDGALAWGGIYDVAVQRGLALSFFNSGRAVPDDFSPAEAGGFVEYILTGGAANRRARSRGAAA